MVNGLDRDRRTGLGHGEDVDDLQTSIISLTGG